MKEIIEKNRGRIRAVIKKLIGRYDEDLEQEVYIKAWQNKEKYNEEGKLAQWLSIITANLCRDYFRSRRYHEQILSDNTAEALENISIPCPQEKILDSKRRQKIILQAVDELPKPLRQIIYLFEFEELSYEQIAKKEKIPVGTVKSRLYNARKILNQKLQFLKGE